MDQSRLFKDNVKEELYDKLYKELEKLRVQHPSYRDDQLLMFMLCQRESWRELEAAAKNARPVPPAIATGFYKSVLEVVETRYPDAVAKWDHNDYVVFGPLSLDDEAKVVVSLRSKRGAHDIVLAL